MTLDAIVVGAGPAGSAAAAGLARAGARVVVLDRARHPRPKACAEYASPRIVEELRRIGLAATEWDEHAVPLSGMQMHASGRSVRITYADPAGWRPAWGVDRLHFDERLARHAADSGADLREGFAAIALAHDNGRISGVRVRDLEGGGEEELRADWVIGADGARSSIARLLGVDRPIQFPRRLGLIAHHSGVEGLTDHGEMHVGDGYYVGLAPTPRGELNVGMALPLTDHGAPASARFDDAINRLPAVQRRLSDTTRLTPIRGAAPIGHRVAGAAGPGWLLIGDAAGFLDPFTGEGIHRALRSARAAVDALQHPDPATGYRRERRRAFAAKTALSWLIQAVLAVPPLLGHAVARLDERPEAALRLGSALGDLRPATDALSPRALVELLRP